MTIVNIFEAGTFVRASELLSQQKNEKAYEDDRKTYQLRASTQ